MILPKANYDKLRQIAWERGATIESSIQYNVLDEIKKHLPVLEDYEYYAEVVYLFKICGNVQPHIDKDSTDATLFILLDVIYPNELGYADSKVNLITDKFTELNIYEPVIFDHSKEHAVLTDLAWCGIAIPLVRK